jgi:hypothetical protein
MHSIKNQFALENPALDEILLRVRPVVNGYYGVYADAMLIAILPDQAAADAHCQRLLSQQVEGRDSQPAMPRVPAHS